MIERGATKYVSIQSFNQKDTEKVESFPSDAAIEKIHKVTNLENEQSSEIITNDSLDTENVVEDEYCRIFESTSKDTSTDHQRNDSKLAKIRTSVFKQTFSAIQKISALLKCTFKKESFKKEEAKKPRMKDVSTTYNPFPLKSESFNDKLSYRNKYCSYFLTSDQESSHMDTMLKIRSKTVPIGSKSTKDDNGMFQMLKSKFELEESRKKSSSTSKLSNFLFTDQLEAESTEIARDSVNTKEPQKSVDSKFKRVFCFKKNSKDKSKNHLQSNSFNPSIEESKSFNNCEKIETMIFPCQPKSSSKANKSQYEIAKATWLIKYVTSRIESKNSVKIRWSNDMYRSSNSTTVLELMENIYKGNRFSMTSQQNEYNTNFSSSSLYQSRIQFTQQLYAYMLPRIFYNPSYPYKSQNKVLTTSKYKSCDRIKVTRYDPKLHVNYFKAISDREVRILSENILKKDREINNVGTEIDSDSQEQTSEKLVCIVDYESERSYYGKNSTPKISDAGDYEDRNTNDISVGIIFDSGKSATFETIIERLPKNPEELGFKKAKCDVIGTAPIVQEDTRLVESAIQTDEYRAVKEDPEPKTRISEYVCEFAPYDPLRKSRSPKHKVPQKCCHATGNTCRYKSSLSSSKCYMFLEPLSSASKWDSVCSSRRSMLSHSLPEILVSPVSTCKMCRVLVIEDFFKNPAMPLESSKQMFLESNSDCKIILPMLQSCSTVFMSTKDKSGRKKYYAATFKRKSKWRTFFSRQESEVAKIKTEVFEGISFLNRSGKEVKSTLCRPLMVDTSVGEESPLNKRKQGTHHKRKCACRPRVPNAHKSTHVSQLDFMACKCTLTTSSSSYKDTSKHSYLKENNNIRASLVDNCYFEKCPQKEHLDKCINTDGRILVTVNEPNVIEKQNEEVRQPKDMVIEKRKKQRECSNLCPFKNKQHRRHRLFRPTTSYNKQSESPDEITEDHKNVCCKMSESYQPPCPEVAQKNSSASYNYDKKKSCVKVNFKAPLPILINKESNQNHIHGKSSKSDGISGGCCCCNLSQKDKNKSYNNRSKEPNPMYRLPLPILQPFPISCCESNDSHLERENQKNKSKIETPEDYQTEPCSVKQGPFQETERICRRNKQTGCLKKRKQHSYRPLPLPMLQEPFLISRDESRNTIQGQEKIEETNDCRTKTHKQKEFLEKSTNITPKSSAIGSNQKLKTSQYTNVYQSKEYLTNIRYNQSSEHDKITCLNKNEIITNHDDKSYMESPSCFASVKDDSSSLKRLPTETGPLIEKLFTPSLHEVSSNNIHIKRKDNVKAKDFKSIEINLQLQVTQGQDTESRIAGSNKTNYGDETNKIDSGRYNMKKAAEKEEEVNNPKKELNIRILIKNKNKKYNKKDVTTRKYIDDIDSNSINEFSQIKIKNQRFESPNNNVDDNDDVKSQCCSKKQLNLKDVETLLNFNNVEKNVTAEENFSKTKQLTRDTRKVLDQNKTTNVFESSTTTDNSKMNAKRKKKSKATVNEAEILQMYEMKKAVLDIYAERTEAIDGSERYVAKLPKFVHKAEKHLYNSLDSFNDIEPCNWNRNFILMQSRR